MDKGVGPSLREARSRRKLSLGEVEEATKIRGRYLRALENEEWDELPGDTYARAFVRTYATLLGLDADRLADEVRRSSGGTRPGERMPRVDPRPQRAAPRRPLGRPSRISPKLLAALVSAALIVVLVAVGIAGQGGSGPAVERQTGGKAEARSGGGKEQKGGAGARRAKGHTVALRAEAEVWVCLLGGAGKLLVPGLILAPGETAGPFRSGSFTMAFGNGAVTMTVDGRQANIGESSSPVGFSLGDGGLRELPEGDRPSCT
ncbi:MAG TPA: helix-turn-helix domain-containing protein [Solirubrobacterales bacterium]|jgi:hypothetical protein|nr:helix-turn-helix domain-containing protein [Solirubrobacterales bacterium]